MVGARRRAPLVAMVRGVSESFSKAITRNPQPIDIARAKLQHAAYIKVLGVHVEMVHEIAAAPQLPDCVFIEDAAVSIGSKILITQPGAPSRQAEVEELAATLDRPHVWGSKLLAAHKNPWTVVRMQDEGALLDGGDVLLTHSHCFVGLSSRTNEAGFKCLRRLLADQMAGGQDTIMAIEVLDDLHLKSLVTHAGHGHLAVDASRGGQHVEASLNRLLGAAHGYTLHYMPAHAATNVVRVGHSLLVAENCGAMSEVQELARAARINVAPSVTSHLALEKEGIEEVVRYYGDVIEVPNSEFAKADGALSCRSLLLPYPHP